MNSRAELARELWATGYIKSWLDFSELATALEINYNKNSILSDMPELGRWPSALEWLRERL